MYPPSQSIQLDIDAISGILGSISIACWVVVFSPQIIENFRRSSAEGLSIVFIVAWLAGDVFNILGAVLQGVLPTMVILAVYYTLADIVLLLQCFYYRGFTLSDEVKKPGDTEAVSEDEDEPPEAQPLLRANSRDRHAPNGSNGHHYSNGHEHSIANLERRGSHSSFREHLLSLDVTHLSPATPLHDARPPAPPEPSRNARLKAFFFNLAAVLLVCLAGIIGWWLTVRGTSRTDQGSPKTPAEQDEVLKLSLWGQIFGYICAVLYLGSRIPQLLLNYRRKSTEGISMLFFLFACVGNLTYVLSIAAYKPVCEGKHCRAGEAVGLYGRYILVNLSWLLGSAGTLLLDLGVFVQFFLYRDVE